jgi:DNA-binding NarL/FixJ family response regulator
MRILVVDDHASLRSLLRKMIGEIRDMEIVGEASNGLEAIERNGQLHPDVILMDLSMPVMDGMSASRIIKNTDPNVQILIFSSHKFAGLIRAAKALGLSGFVSKGEDADPLIEALDAVAHNGTYFPS